MFPDDECTVEGGRGFFPGIENVSNFVITVGGGEWNCTAADRDEGIIERLKWKIR